MFLVSECAFLLVLLSRYAAKVAEDLVQGEAINEHFLLLLICNKSKLLLNIKPKSRMQTPENILNTIKTMTQYLQVLIRIFQ